MFRFLGGNAFLSLAGELEAQSQQTDPGPIGLMEAAAILVIDRCERTDPGPILAAKTFIEIIEFSPRRVGPQEVSAAPILADVFVPSGAAIGDTIDLPAGESPNPLQISAGKPAASLECSLFDKATGERPAVRVRSLSGACVLQWKQATQGRVTLRIRNLGSDTYYVLSSN